MLLITIPWDFMHTYARLYQGKREREREGGTERTRKRQSERDGKTRTISNASKVRNEDATMECTHTLHTAQYVISYSKLLTPPTCN